MIKKNRATDGFENEKDFIIKLNMNKDHKFWQSFELKDNSKYYFIKVEGLKLCKSTNKAILPKSDVYICKINIDQQDVLKQGFYFDEKSKIDIIEYLKNSGVSIKMRNTNYQIDKCSIKKFVARFKDKELFAGATIYSQNTNDFKKNHKVLKASNTTWKEFANYFNEQSLDNIKDETVFDDSHKLIFKRIQKISYNRTIIKIAYELLPALENNSRASSSRYNLINIRTKNRRVLILAIKVNTKKSRSSEKNQAKHNP